MSRESVSWENSVNAMWEKKKKVHNSLIRPADFHRHLFKCKWGVYSMGGASASTSLWLADYPANTITSTDLNTYDQVTVVKQLNNIYSM